VVRMRSVLHLLVEVRLDEFTHVGGPLDLEADLTSVVCNNAESDEVLLLGLHSNLARLIEDSQLFERCPTPHLRGRVSGHHKRPHSTQLRPTHTPPLRER
jgi:hypothetical protein